MNVNLYTLFKHTHTYIYIYTRINTYTYIYIYTYVCIYICLYIVYIPIWGYTQLSDTPICLGVAFFSGDGMLHPFSWMIPVPVFSALGPGRTYVPKLPVL